MSLKDNLKKQRRRANLSQEGLAEDMSVSRQTISKWENGDTYPSTEHILMLTKILNCSMDELVDNTSSQVVNTSCVTPIKRNFHYWAGTIVVILIAVLSLTVFGFINSRINNIAIDESKIAVFDKILDGSLDEAIAKDGYVKKKIVGYGIAEATRTFFIKCDVYKNGTESPCSAIIYLCEENGNYSCECQYLDNPDYVPKGEYYEVG